MQALGNKLKASPCAVIQKMHEHRRSLINATSSFLSGHNIVREESLALVILLLLKLSDIYCNVYDMLLSGLLSENRMRKRCRQKTSLTIRMQLEVDKEVYKSILSIYTPCQ